ncbi:MAG: ABC transporter ATP-binding protein [Pseudonocardiaceae bacterium]|nr:MAG: ABC transporter ATP-binding protein [Pseudonocardiaceae bacterium]
MNEPLLRAQGLTRRFGGLVAVDSVSIDVADGEVHGLIGPNGAGKTTLVNMLTGVDRIDDGTVHFAGEETTGLPSHKLASRGIARSFQTSQLFEDEDVLANVMAGRHRHLGYRFPNNVLFTPRTSREEKASLVRCAELLEMLKLADVAHRHVGELSYGRRRLVEIARALATEPRLLVLDEPAAGLSGADVDLLEAVLRDLSAAAYTILIIEHNIGLVMGICDRVTVLAEGAVLAQGPPAEVRVMPEVITAYLGRSAA